MTQRAWLLRFAQTAALVASFAALAGCGFVSKIATKKIADTLSKSGDVYTRDDDPELVRRAVPFALKTYESLLDTLPKHGSLLLAACSGFTSYSFAFVQTDADILGEANHHREVKALTNEALGLYVRAKDYCLRALEVRFPGVTTKLMMDDPAALAWFSVPE